jgi:hypothetical protein
MITAIEDNSSADTQDNQSGGDHAESDAGYVARGLGQLPGGHAPPPRGRLLLDAAQAAVRLVGLDAPIRDSADASDRIAKVEAEQDKVDPATTNAEQAGDLTAAVVAAVPISDLTF